MPITACEDRAEKGLPAAPEGEAHPHSGMNSLTNGQYGGAGKFEGKLGGFTDE